MLVLCLVVVLSWYSSIALSSLSISCGSVHSILVSGANAKLSLACDWW